MTSPGPSSRLSSSQDPGESVGQIHCAPGHWCHIQIYRGHASGASECVKTERVLQEITIGGSTGLDLVCPTRRFSPTEKIRWETKRR